jgi:RNA polymerase sigma-70 factor (ECF subfamily)
LSALAEQHKLPGRRRATPHAGYGHDLAGKSIGAGVGEEGLTATARPERADDATLMAAIAVQGSTAAFAPLFDRYAGRVKAFLMRAGASAEEAEEGAQEVMVTLWRRAGLYDPARASVSTWVHAMARNRRIDMARRAARGATADPGDPLLAPDPVEAAEAGHAARERDGRVRHALAALPEEQLAVIRLSFFAGLTQSEIAERLGAPLGTVKSRLRLGFRRLREALGDDFHTELLDE